MFQHQRKQQHQRAEWIVKALSRPWALREAREYSFACAPPKLQSRKRESEREQAVKANLKGKKKQRVGQNVSAKQIHSVQQRQLCCAALCLAFLLNAWPLAT